MSADVVSERQILALTLAYHSAVGKQFLALPADVWFEPTHEPVATVLRDRLVRGLPIDPLTVAADAAAAVGTDHVAEQVRRFVIEATSWSPALESFGYYAERVLMHATIRRAQRHATRLQQQLEYPSGAEDVARAIRSAVDDLSAAESSFAAAETEPPLSLQAIMDTQDEAYDWLVPGLLERTDRLIVTGYEGTGKSYLLAQMALTVAAGLHPFAGTLSTPSGHRVLVIDCENSRRQIKRRYELVVPRINMAREMYGLSPIDWSEHLRFVIRPDGIDLSSPQEFSRIEAAVAATAPDLVVAGPLYRLHKANINEELAARELVDALDRLRVKYQFTLICEAHVGHVGENSGGRKLRPTGSSLFLRWPEFGYGIRAYGATDTEHPETVEVVAWRGSRDERVWPHLLRHSQVELPWTPADHEYRTKTGMTIRAVA